MVCGRSLVAPVLPLLVACNQAGPPDDAAHERLAMLTEVAAASGLDFRHSNGASGELYYPEIMGAGVAMFDYDNDGDLDVYLVQGAALGVPGEAGQPGNRLYRNELVPAGRLAFTDVTRQAGVGDPGYGMGVAIGDYDVDGYEDLYVTNFGANVLYRNLGDGRFADVTGQAGAGDERWSTSASFADFDADGLPDLYIANYEAFSVGNNKSCFHKDGRRDYCGPDIYDGVDDRLLHNEGDGRFRDVTADFGIRGAQPGLGVAALELDDKPAYLVANDARANQLWRRHGRSFVDAGLDSGVAFNVDGRAEASMGIAIGDYDNDGDEDIFLSHLATETNTLYKRAPGYYYYDVTDSAGLGSPSLPFTGFGTGFFDLDNDGWLDLFVANGGVIAEETRLGISDYPYEQRNQLFRNTADGRFEEILPGAEPALALIEVSRGVAFGDVDNDGDTDIVVTNNNGPVRLLRNDAGNRQHWVGVDLRSAGAAGEAARVSVVQGERVWVRRVRRDGSYLSSGDPRILAGLGDNRAPVDVVVRWHGHPAEIWSSLAGARYWSLRPGEGEALSEYCASAGAGRPVCRSQP